ncbi:hypothetical protein RHGRI_017012 [Rhododendron griersonianum]|uniref:DUF7812 domain-containing protein n=1 Tax=Rhododendron griersonianum TaxID=479676 RepID=A0AAV6JW85_9ERIC|nr:hypothetical protein RHGRI_017012 [Rhododendron griersonianum]
MGRSKNPKQNRRPTTQQSPPSQPIQNLIYSLQAPQGLKPPILKRLYNLLLYLSSNHPIRCQGAGADSTFWGIRVSLEDIYSLSDILFKELSKTFNQFLSALRAVSVKRALRQASLHSAIWAITELLNLLLRCCMVILNLLVPDRALENGQVLLDILGELCSLGLPQENEENIIGFEKVSLKYTYKYNHCTASSNEDIVASLHFMEPVNPSLPFLRALLEVFADELLVHGQLRQYFMLIDSLPSTSRKLFICRSSHGDLGSVTEIVSTHFCLAFSDDQAFENFLNGLWAIRKYNRAPELSLTASSVLLLNDFMLSAPKFLHAHLISLVSDAVAFDLSLVNMRADFRLMDCYLSAFERSVILYVKHMSNSQRNDYPSGDSVRKTKKYGGNSQPTFESYIQPVTRQKVKNLITKLDSSWQSELHMLLRTKSDLTTSSIAYVKESKHILDTSFREEIIAILSCIIWEAFSSEVDDATLHASGKESPQDICLLASILKLMSCSLRQSIWCLRHDGNLGCLKTLKDFSSCKEYDTIVGIISCFQQVGICLPVQKSLCRMMEIHPEAHKESRVMLLHFSGLLSLSFSTGLDFLVKGCISTMISLMNLILFEEGNLYALRFDHRSESFSLHPDNVPEAKVEKKSSLLVASKFLKIQTLYLSVPSLSSEGIGHENKREDTLTRPSTRKSTQCVVGIEEETEETCNGKIFLKCRLENRGKPSDFDDLADFIECKRGKDYTGWLKDRQRYRKWKCEKMAVLRWKKRKTLKFMKGKKT